jgi:hypothetical protein
MKPTAVRRRLAWAWALVIVWAGCGEQSTGTSPCSHEDGFAGGGWFAEFRGDPTRIGWRGASTKPTRALVSKPGFGLRWSSPPLPSLVFNGAVYPAHVYASPLYLGGLAIVGSSNGDVVALTTAGLGNESCGQRPAGRIRWQVRLGRAAPIPKVDGGMPFGILSTPILGPRGLHVVARDHVFGWQVWTLDAATGKALPGWPVTLSPQAVEAVNRNGPAKMQDSEALSQRGALALSPDGNRLYVTFGAFLSLGAGWIVAVRTDQPGIEASFSGAPEPKPVSAGGIWSAAGPAVDAQGHVWVTTGNAPGDSREAPGYWGSSLLHFDATLKLLGTYTPWNYAQLDASNLDLGGSSPILFDLDPKATSTPHLTAFSSKQGNVYLLDRDHLPGGTKQRPPPGSDPSLDGSLLPPQPQPQFAHMGQKRGPLNVFGPYSETYGSLDHAKTRSTPAYFRDDDTGSHYLFAAGATKKSEASTESVPPGLVRLRIVAEPGQPAYLQRDRDTPQNAFTNPGSPLVTGERSEAVVWVIDPVAPRTASLLDPDVARPRLYAFSAKTLELLWDSGPSGLHVGGKYMAPAVVDGLVFVATDRLQAFGAAP